MIRKYGAIAMLLASALALSACVVAAPGPYGGRPRCPGAWVPGHYGPEGFWHPGHCA
jgi:hypothetical protein